jgi:hypothetical protein
LFLLHFFQEEKLEFYSMSTAQTCRGRLIRKNENFSIMEKACRVREREVVLLGCLKTKPLDSRYLRLLKKMVSGFFKVQSFIS